ncbi:hypothetical protein [Deinococcus yavapaiensis]|uniref:Uncharacterized protein n=1 Tax=Deinococcus yavapaiensis KR-236 TaxID=694435 RepID=A0A318SB24_9DEIO|nr:hypothetical protein [Deinococcus yavapaiensis]PYE55420.1 hypothetical protein DES52_103253 [Deinococcus yavapaiensis KR-236]
MNVRTLGFVTMICAPAMLANAFRHDFQRVLNGQDDVIGNLTYLVFAIGWFCSMLALRQLHATGHGKLGSFVVTLPLVTIALAALQGPFDILHVDMNSPLYAVTDLTWPLSMLLTFVVSVAALFARVLPMPHRLAPLACGISLPVGFAYMAFARLEDLPQAEFAWHTAIGWFLLGLALVTLGARRSAVQARPA